MNISFFTINIFSLIVFPIYFYLVVNAMDYISFSTQTIYSRFIYFLFPKKIFSLKKKREYLSEEVLEFTNNYIEGVDEKLRAERKLYESPVKDETDFLIRRNSERKIKIEHKVELERLLQSIN